MKSVILVALALVAVTVAIPVDKEKEVKIESYVDEHEPDGSYHYEFKTNDGTYKSETGELKAVVDSEGKTQTVVAVRGEYGYTDTQGKLETVTYGADELGYRADGPSIPKAARR